MGIVKWAAIGVTALMGLANVGLLGQDVAVVWKVLGVVLALPPLAAVVGLIARKAWGRSAVIAIGAINVAAAVIGAVAGLDGWPIGLVLSALGVVLGVVYVPSSRTAVLA